MARKRRKQLGIAGTTPWVFGGLAIAGIGLVGAAFWLIEKGK